MILTYWATQTTGDPRGHRRIGHPENPGGGGGIGVVGAVGVDVFGGLHECGARAGRE